MRIDETEESEAIINRIIHNYHFVTMSFAFDRPIGAPGDIAELEYIAALHQTDVPGGIRKDGSIQGEYNVAQLLARCQPIQQFVVDF